MPTPKRKPLRGERTLISIHGILSDGAWQRNYATVFDPRFHYEQFGYTEFLDIGSAFLGLALEWVVLLSGSGVILWAWFHGYLSKTETWAISVLLLILALLAANLLAESRRNKVVREFAASRLGLTTAACSVAIHRLRSMLRAATGYCGG